MEAAIRTAYYVLAGKEMESFDIEAVRGITGIKEASLTVPTKDFGDLQLNVVVAHGLGNARKVMEWIESGEKNYHFVEIMACPGGCVGGGGQPYGSSIADRARRGISLYKEDKSLPKRCSHQNDEVMECYKEYLGEPNSPKAHKLLHTNYFERSKMNGEAVKAVTHKH